jgi:uncharacterized protein YecE (DUF72 family)
MSVALPRNCLPSRYFNTCEINATFYPQFKPKIAERWCEALDNPAFEFAIKVNQAFTQPQVHCLASGKLRPGWRACSTRKRLSMRLGAFWTPLPTAIACWSSCSNFPSRSNLQARTKDEESIRLEGNWDHVADVLNAFSDYPKAIELRHEGWDDPWVLGAFASTRPLG